MQLLSPYQGLQFDRNLQIKNLDGTDAAGVFSSTSILQASVWEGQNQAEIFAPTVDWYTATTPVQTGYDQGQFTLSIAGSQTATLDPAGEYTLLVTETTGGVTAPVWEGRLKVLATPGSTSPNPPDLITYDYAESALSELVLTDSQRDFLPYLVAAASAAIRRWCGDRYFTLATFTESYPVALDGYVRLNQIPVNRVTRVQSSPSLALTVQNTSSAVQVAQVYFDYTGQFGGSGSNTLVVSGLILDSVSSGVVTSTTVAFTAGMTVADLVILINAVGSGWIATTTSTALGLWPVTELDGGLVGQGCASPSSGATFNVLLDLAAAQLTPDGQATGMLWVGRQGGSSSAQQWGPGGDDLFSGSGAQTGRVKITYVAGFSTIPPQVQFACAELIKAQMLRIKIDTFLKSEKAADYSYELSPMAIQGLPPEVLQGLAPFRLHYA